MKEPMQASLAFMNIIRLSVCFSSWLVLAIGYMLHLMHTPSISCHAKEIHDPPSQVLSLVFSMMIDIVGIHAVQMYCFLCVKCR